MRDNQTILKLVPSLRARQLPDGRIVLTQKFIDGVIEFQKSWAGPLDVYFQPSEQPSGNLDEMSISPDDCTFRIRVSPIEEIAKAIVADSAAVVLLSMDDFRQSGLGAVCRRNGIPCAYITEYSLTTRKQIVDAGTANPLKRLRRKVWEMGEERKRRRAAGRASGLQCNGTPTYDSYRHLSRNALLYFDTRVHADLLATPYEVQKRLAARLPGEPLRLLFSGRLISSKGAHQLVGVAKELRKQQVNFHLSICGDGDLRPVIAQQIRAEQLDAYVRLDGVREFKSELVPFVKSNIDLFVCCHPQGDPSCTYLETMSCGVPIAGYANEAFEGIVSHSGCGWAVPLNNPRALASRIAEIRRSPDALLKMSLASLAFSKDHTFDQTFSRRIKHLRDLEERNEQGRTKLNAYVANV